MQEKLGDYRLYLNAVLANQYIVHVGIDYDKTSWKHWLKTAWKKQLTITNWPSSVVPAPGPNFDVKKLTVPDFKMLHCAYLRKHDQFSVILDGMENEATDTIKELNIIRWNKGKIYTEIMKYYTNV